MTRLISTMSILSFSLVSAWVFVVILVLKGYQKQLHAISENSRAMTESQYLHFPLSESLESWGIPVRL